MVNMYKTKLHNFDTNLKVFDFPKIVCDNKLYDMRIKKGWGLSYGN